MPRAKHRYSVKWSGAFVHGHRVWEIIDAQTGQAVYDGVVKQACIAKCKTLNAREASYPGGYNRRLK